MCLFRLEHSHISDPLIWKETDANRILIRKVVAKKTFTRAAVDAILRKAWNLSEGFDVIEINGNAFMFNFVKEEEFNRVLRGRPWSINEFLLNLMERSKYKTCEEFDFSHGPVWIQMHNVPMEALCLANAVTIGNHVGKVMMAEDPIYNGKFVRGFMRARVLIDLRKPLSHGFWMDRPEGKKAWITIRYEKLQNFCYYCGRIGHDNRLCKSEQLMSMFDSTLPRFGAWLTTNVCRNREVITEIIQEDWVEARYVQKKKEEALQRSRDDEALKENKSPELQESDLFVIRLNNHLQDSVGVNLAKVAEGRGAAKGSMDAPAKVNMCVKAKRARDECRERKEVCEGMEEMQNTKSMLGADYDSSQAGERARHLQEMQASQEVNSMAMIVYNGEILGEVVNRIGQLGLKRCVDEEWECPKPKRSRKGMVEPAFKHEISNYAESLRKTKSRAKRNAKRRCIQEE
ncbi:hypothetical protein K1719_042108 [Acacia pycnantha]|nr:hypothetical protein K1719_042108 [Acacia pycnantha]